LASAAGGVRQQKLPPLTPQYEHDPASGVTRVSLPLSLVEGASGASSVEFGARYAYDKEWRYAGTMNEVMIFFGMKMKRQICSGRCQLTLTTGGERSSFEVEVQPKLASDGTASQTISFWLKPQAFKKLAAASSVEIQIGDVSFHLSARQVTGMRQMIPFLKERLLP
jgi:hypothetical protein